MAAFDTALNLPNITRDPNGPISLAIGDSSKPERRKEPECRVVHAAVEWSEANIELDLDEAAESLFRAFSRIAGPFPPVKLVMGHRWRFSRATKPLGNAYCASEDGTLLAGCNSVAGRDVADALSSSRAMAKATVNRCVLE